MNRLSKFSAFVRIEGAVPRARLLARMLGGPPEVARTTFLVAPAGFGKTTLLAQSADALRQDGALTVWLNCDREDRQPQVLLKSLARAYAAAAAAAGSFEDTDTPIADVFSGQRSSQQPVTFFLDEYDAASSPDTDLLLQDIARSLGPLVRLFVGCRETTSLDLSEISLQGVARVVDAAELRFGPEEVRVLFAGQLSDATLIRISDITDGWAVVLQLIRLGIPTASGVTEGPGQATRTWLGQADGMLPAGKIFAYLATEIWDRLPLELRDFMEATAPLGYIDAASADWLRERTDSAGLIARLSELHPIVNFDAQALVARLHPLLREFLVHRLARRGASTLPALQARAAAYFESIGATFDAVTHALHSSDPAEAVHIIERAGGFRMAVPEGVWYLKNLLSLLPESMIRQHARIRLMEICTAVVEDNSAENRFLLDQVEASMIAAGAAEDSNPAWIDMRFSRGVEMLGMGERSLVYSPWEALAALKQDALIRINQDPRLLGLVLIVELLLVQRCGDAVTAEQRTDALGRLNQRFRLVANNIWHPIYEAQNDFRACRLDSAERRLRELLTAEFDLFRLQQSAFGQMTYALLGRVHFARGEPEEALACFERIPDTQISPFLEVSEGAIICRAFCEMALGRPAQALERLQREQLRAQAQQRPACACLIDATRVELLCRTGDVSAARGLWEKLRMTVRASGVENERARDDVPWCVTQAICRARFYLAMSSQLPEDARAIAAGLLQSTRERHRVISEVMANVLLCEATFAMAEPQAANHMLVDALTLCQLPPPAQLFLEHGIHLAGAIRVVADGGGRSAEAAAMVIRIWEREFAVSIASLKLLSHRESEVIVQLMRGHSTKKIARDMALSPETVKFHLKSIFAKLGVNTRDAAVLEAYRRVLIQRGSGGVSRLSEGLDHAPAVGYETED